MDPEELEHQWQYTSQQAARAMREWRQAHPKATLAQIEAAVDEQMNQMRARMIEEVAHSSACEQADQGKRQHRCPQCGKPMQARGKHTRSLQTQGGQVVTLTRQYQSCPFCGYSFFPPR